MKNIRFKIVSIILSFALFIWITVFAIGYVIYPKTLDKLLKQTGINETTVLSIQCIDYVLTNNIVQLDRLVNNMRKHHDYIDYSFILNADNKLLVHTFGTKFPADLLNANKTALPQ